MEIEFIDEILTIRRESGWEVVLEDVIITLLGLITQDIA